MSKEAKSYLEQRSISNIVIDTVEATDIYLSDVLHDYAKHYYKDKKNEPVETIAVRKHKFIHKVNDYMSTYSHELIDQFIDYWTEHNEGGKKMRFETHKIFNISKRLGTWNRNNQKFNKKTDESNNRYNVGEQDYHATLADVRPGLSIK